MYTRTQTGRGQGIFAKPLQGDAPPFAVVSPLGPNTALAGFRISPNGRCIAYLSTESGTNEIYIAPFPKGEGKWQVSNGGGDFPAWRGDSKEIFFWSNADEVFAADITEQNGELQVGTPKSLFRTNASAIGAPYDVDRSGQRFLVNRAEDEASTALNLISNWTSELKKKQ